MEFDDKVPIYYQIKTYLYHEMIIGRLAPCLLYTSPSPRDA